MKIHRPAIPAGLALGFSALAAQLLLVRECLTVFAGNELAAGIVLGNWLWLSGAGAKLGSLIRDERPALRRLFLVLAASPLASIFLIRTAVPRLLAVGAEAGPLTITLAGAGFLMPCCLTSGAVFTLLCRVFSGTDRQEATASGIIYGLDAAGAAAAGVVFSFFAVRWLHPLQCAALIMGLLAIISRLFADPGKGRPIPLVLALASLLIVILDNGAQLEIIISQDLFPGQKIVFWDESPYGRMVITRSGPQQNLYENGVLFFSDNNIQKNEETIHYAFTQNPGARRVLLVSGGIAGTIREALKYPVRVDYVELDPLILKAGEDMAPELADPRVRVIRDDARRFVNRTNKQYDLALIDLPDPLNAGINRYYTVEFFKALKKRLTPGGVVSLSLLSYKNHLSGEAAALLSSINNTLSLNFRNVMIIPGGRFFLLASDNPLTPDIASVTRSLNMQNVYVNDDYLRGVLTGERLSYTRDSINKAAPPNRDFHPVSYYYNLLYWLSGFARDYWALLLAAGAAGLWFIKGLNLEGMIVGATGFSAAVLEFIILLSYQIISGYLYKMLGLLVAAFMLGAAAGSLGVARILRGGSFGRKREAATLILAGFEITMFVVCMALPWLNYSVSGWAAGLRHAHLLNGIFLFYAMVIGCIAGGEYPAALRSFSEQQPGPDAEPGKATGALYLADMAGGALGALLAAAILVPLLGLNKTCFVAGGIHLVFLPFLWRRGGRTVY